MIFFRYLFIVLLLSLPGFAFAQSPFVGGGVDAAATCDDPGDITSSTSLLLQSNHPDGNTVVRDRGPKAHFLKNTDVTHEDAFKPSVGGASSLYFDGANDNLLSKQNLTDFDVGTGDWTIEMIMKSSAANGNLFNIAQPTGSYGHNAFAIDFRIVSGHAYCIVDDGSTYYYAEGSVDIDDNAEHHIVCLRDGTTARIYVDGVQDTTFDVTGLDVVFDTDFAASIGSFPDLSNDYTGYIAELMFTKGMARYPDGTTFDEPTAPYSSTCYELDGCAARIPFSISSGSADVRINVTDSDFITWACGSHDTSDLKDNIAITLDDGSTKNLFEPVATDCTVGNDVDIDFTATAATDYKLYYDCILPDIDWSTTGLGNTDKSESFSTGETGAVPKNIKISNGDLLDDHLETETGWTCDDGNDGDISVATFDGYEVFDSQSSTTPTNHTLNFVECTKDIGTFSTESTITYTVRVQHAELGNDADYQYFGLWVFDGTERYQWRVHKYGTCTHQLYNQAGTDNPDFTLYSACDEDVWHYYTLEIDISAGTCNVYIDDVKVHTDGDCDQTNATADGTIMFRVAGRLEALNHRSYVDRIWVGTGLVGE